jgi:hypothetical protein
MALRYRRSPGTVHRDLGDVVLVLPPRAEAPLELRGGAVHVWAALAGPGTVPDVAAAVGAVLSGVDEDEVAGTVRELAGAGVLSPASAGGNGGAA